MSDMHVLASEIGELALPDGLDRQESILTIGAFDGIHVGHQALIRRLVEHTQAGHEVNLVVCGINVGAQAYWNAEATMLMHNKGVLIMTPGSSMVLTGKKALDYSGGVSAEDHEGTL